MADASCKRAATERKLAHAQMEDGEWFAALHQLERAKASCPAPAESEADEQTALNKLHSEASTEALLDQARAATLEGRLAEAHLLQDQAAFRLEEATGQRITVWLPASKGGSTRVAWQADSQWVLAWSPDGISLRERGEWYPRYFSASFANDGEVYGKAYGNGTISPDATTLVSWQTVRGPSNPIGDQQLSVVSVAPGPGFGRQLARFDVTFSPPPLWLDGGKSIAVRQRAGTLDIVESASGHVLRSINAPGLGNFADIVLGKQGKHLIEQASGGLNIVDVASGAVMHETRAGGYAGVDRMSPDGRYAVWAGPQNEAIVYDVKSRKSRGVQLGKCLAGELPIFDDESRFVALGAHEPVVCVIELASGRVRELHVPGDHGYTFPRAFFDSGAQLMVWFGGAATLITTDTDRVVATTPLARELTRVNGQPYLVSLYGTLTPLDRGRPLRPVEPTPRPDGTLRKLLPLGREIALGFESGWAIVNPETGKARKVAGAGFDLAKSPDDAFLAAENGQGEIVDAVSGQLVQGSPLALAGKVELTAPGGALLRVDSGVARWRAGFTRTLSALANGTAVVTEQTTLPWDQCSGLELRDPSRRYGWDESGEDPNETPEQAAKRSERVPAQLDCATGKRGKVLHFHGYPTALVGPNRLVTTDDDTGLALWDVARGRKLATLPEIFRADGVVAISPDDRLLLLGVDLWDLSQGKRVLQLPEEPQGARFVGNHTLVTSLNGRLSIRSGTDFQERATVLFAHDLSAALVIATQPPGVAPTLEVLGAETAWDTTFRCGAGNRGVPFRVCRQAFSQKGLLAGLLDTDQAPTPVGCFKIPQDARPTPPSSPNPTLAAVRAATERYLRERESNGVPADAEYFLQQEHTEWRVTVVTPKCWDSLNGISGGTWAREVLMLKPSLELLDIIGE